MFMNKLSTDMEELKKKWLEVRKRNSGLSDEGFEVHEKRKALEVFDFFAPHLSNKSELKKEEKMTNNLKNENKIEVVARALYGLHEVIDLDYVIKALTSLIEQEKERVRKETREQAVREFVKVCHKNEIYGDTGIVTGNFIDSGNSDLECLAEQYLAERKDETKKRNR